MDNQAEPCPVITVLGFRKIEKPAEINKQVASWGIQEHLINLVILDYGGSPEERKKLKQIEMWARERSEDVRLSRIPKQQAFLQTYREMIRSPIKTYFLTCLSIDQISKEPLQEFYQKFSAEEDSLSEFNKEAEENLRKIAFIVLKDNMENIDKRNYFHANVALVTSEARIAEEVLQENLDIAIKLRPVNSTSSVNSEDVQQFGESLETVPKAIQVHESDQSQPEKDKDYEAIKLLNNTPGVGTYNIQGNRL